MNILTILLIALGLSFDTFAVSVSTGITITDIRFWQGVKIAVILGLFQGIMPLIGWIAGLQVVHFIEDYDHWVAFILLAFLGIKMAYESIKSDEGTSGFNPLKFTVLIGMAIATSIDALVVGFSFALVDMNIYWVIIAIGMVTFIVAMVGMLFGKKIGARLGKKMEIIGGIILFGIGIKILLSHIL